jgi:simple sugar transport system permease protein
VTVQNLFDLLTSYTFVGILALGLLVVLIAGGIDISFTATASVAQYVALAAANAYGANWLIVFAIAIGVGGTLGAINAILIQKLRIPSIIVSVATLNIFYGLLIFFTGGKYIYSLPDWFEAEMSQVHEQIKRIGYGQAPDLDGVGDVPRAIAAPKRNAH